MGARHLPPPQKTLKINMFCEVLGIGQGAPTTSQLPKSFRNHKRKEGGGGRGGRHQNCSKSLNRMGCETAWAGMVTPETLEIIRILWICMVVKGAWEVDGPRIIEDFRIFFDTN